MQLIDHYKTAASFARSLLGYCTQRSIDLVPFAAARDLDVGSFGDTHSYVSLAKFVALMEDLAEAADDPAFGLRFGGFFRLGDTGPFGFGLANAPSLEQAIRFGQRFHQLTADYGFFDIQIGADDTRFQWRYSPLLGDCGQYTDLIAALTVRQLRLCTGESWSPHTVRLMRTKPNTVNIHRELLSSTLTFSAHVNEIIFSNQHLRSRNPNADTRLYKIMEHHCEEMMRARQTSVPLELRIRSELALRLADGAFGLTEIARYFAMSERNLQRQLSESGTSYDQLLDQTRQELAGALFRSGCSLDEISGRLGYSGQTAFSRAVKKWFGKPPGEYRADLANVGSDQKSRFSTKNP